MKKRILETNAIGSMQLISAIVLVSWNLAFNREMVEYGLNKTLLG